MQEVWHRYLANIPWQRVSSCLRAYSVEAKNLEHLSATVLETAALCRLAHSSVVGASESPPRSHMLRDTLAATNQRLTRGRPKSARWAFWTGFLLRQNLKIGGKPPTHELLADLIGILLAPRRITSKEVRTMFMALRREAETCATTAAEAALKQALKSDMSEQDFIGTFTELETGLLPTAQYAPMIVNGKLNRGWLDTVVRVRRAVLRHVSELGVLGDTAPVVTLGQSTQVGGMTLGGGPQPGAVIHLDKSTQVPLPGIPSEGGTYSMSFPFSALCNEPSAAYLSAAPAWLFKWHNLFVAVPQKPVVPSNQRVKPTTPGKRKRQGL